MVASIRTQVHLCLAISFLLMVAVGHAASPTPIDCVHAATLTLDCTGGLGLAGTVNNMRLRFHSGTQDATDCGLAVCTRSTSSAACSRWETLDRTRTILLQGLVIRLISSRSFHGFHELHDSRVSEIGQGKERIECPHVRKRS